MADKTNTISTEVGDITIPAWASEATMSRVAGYAAAEAKTNAKFAKIMQKAGGNLQELQKEIAGLIQVSAADNRNDQAAQKKTEQFADRVVDAASSLTKTMKFFEKSEQPLSAMVDGASGLAKGLQKAGKGFDFTFGLMDNTGTAYKALGVAADVAIDAALAYAGWNAAKIEQFAQAQARIIDAGVVFNQGAESFDDIRKLTIATGVTYTALIDNVHQFGEGMLGLGTTMSSGVDQFTKFYASLDQVAENFGDLGLQSKEMQAQYAEYLVFARRTGRINSDLNNSAEEVNNSFINLQIEAGAVANLTALTRAEAMRRKMQAYGDFGEAALTSMRDLGLTDAANTADALIQSLGTIAPESEMFNTVLQAVTQEAFEKSGNLGEFDISARLQSMSPGLEAAIDSVYPNFISGLEEIMQNSDSNAASTYIFQALEKADLSRMASISADSTSIAGQIQAIQAQNNILLKRFGQLAEPNALEEEMSKQKKNLKEAGKVTQEMNNMTRRFLEMQETLTLDMATTAAAFDRITGFFTDETKKLMDIANLGQEVNDFGGIGGQANQHIVAAQGGVISNTAPDSAITERVEGSDANETTQASVAAHNELLGNEITPEQLSGFTTLHNAENTAAQLNTLQPIMRQRLLSALADFETQYAGSDKKITVSMGNVAIGPDGEINFQNQGMGVSILAMAGDTAMGNDDSGFYSSPEFQSILQNNMLSSSATPGLGQIVPLEAESASGDYNQFFIDTQGGNLTAPTAHINDNVIPQNRMFGGPVQAGKPYFVGDKLGLDTAEIFVPDQSGTIINNNQVTNSIGQLSDRLTNSQNNSIINSTTDLSGLLESKKQVINNVKILQSIIKRLNSDGNYKTAVDMMNSR